MSDLDVQIRVYIDAVSERLTVDDVQGVPMGDGQVRPLKPVPAKAGLRRRWAVAAAAAAVLIVMVPVLWMATGTEPDVGAPGPDEGVGIDPASTVAETGHVNPPTDSGLEAPIAEVTETAPVAAPPPAAAVSALLPAEAKAELLSAVLEVGEILELPVTTIHANRGDAGAGMVMDVMGEFDTGQPGAGLLHRIITFETPDAASAWLEAQTSLENRPWNENFSFPGALPLGDESGVARHCGGICPTYHLVRLAEHIVEAPGHEDFDAALVAEAALSALASPYAPRLELSVSVPAAPYTEPRMASLTATGESTVSLVWRIPAFDFHAEHARGDGCHVDRTLVDPVGRRVLAEDVYRITPDGSHQRGVGDGLTQTQWEAVDDREAPFDDVRYLCDQPIIVPPVLMDEYAPSDWQIDEIAASGSGAYTGAEATSGYRLDADQVISAGLLPTGSTLSVLVAELSNDELLLIVQGSHGEMQDAFGLTFREIDPAGTVTVEYAIEDGW